MVSGPRLQNRVRFIEPGVRLGLLHSPGTKGSVCGGCRGSPWARASPHPPEPGLAFAGLASPSPVTGLQAAGEAPGALAALTRQPRAFSSPALAGATL